MRDVQGGMPLKRTQAMTWQRLLRVFILCQGVTASVCGTYRVTNHDEWRFRKNNGDGLLYSILSHNVSWF
jgi:hypothetical protein